MTCTRDCWHPLEQLVVWFRGLKPSEDTCLPKDALAGPSCGADASFLGCAPSCWASCLLEMPLWGVAVSRIYQICSCWATTSFGGCCLETRTLSKRHNPSTLSRWHLDSIPLDSPLDHLFHGARCTLSSGHWAALWIFRQSRLSRLVTGMPALAPAGPGWVLAHGQAQCAPKQWKSNLRITS